MSALRNAKSISRELQAIINQIERGQAVDLTQRRRLRSGKVRTVMLNQVPEQKEPEPEEMPDEGPDMPEFEADMGGPEVSFEERIIDDIVLEFGMPLDFEIRKERLRAIERQIEAEFEEAEGRRIYEKGLKKAREIYPDNFKEYVAELRRRNTREKESKERELMRVEELRKQAEDERRREEEENRLNAEIMRKRNLWQRLDQSALSIPRNNWLDRARAIYDREGMEVGNVNVTGGLSRVLQQFPAIEIGSLYDIDYKIKDWRRCNRCAWVTDGKQCDRYASCHRDSPSLDYCWEHARKAHQEDPSQPNYVRRRGLI